MNRQPPFPCLCFVCNMYSVYNIYSISIAGEEMTVEQNGSYFNLILKMSGFAPWSALEGGIDFIEFRFH